MPIDLDDLRESVARAVFSNDGPREDWYVRDVFVDAMDGDTAEGRVIAHERVSEIFFEIGFTYGDEEAMLADRDDWTEVTQEWVPVTDERMAEMEARKDELIETGTETDGTRRIPDVEGGQHTELNLEEREVRQSSDDERTTVKFMANELARDGLVLRADGLDTDNYMKNPVVLWQHGNDPRRGTEPIATTVDLNRAGDGGWIATVEWAEDEFAQRIKRKVKRGEIRALSLGWHTPDGAVEMERVEGKDRPVITRSELTEFSFLGVGSDPDALVLSRGEGGVDALRNQLQELQSDLEEVRAAVTTASAPNESASDAGENRQSATGDDAASTVPDGQAQENNEPESDRDTDRKYVRLKDLRDLKREIDRKRKAKAKEIAKRKRGMA